MVEAFAEIEEALPIVVALAENNRMQNTSIASLKKATPTTIWNSLRMAIINALANDMSLGFYCLDMKTGIERPTEPCVAYSV